MSVAICTSCAKGGSVRLQRGVKLSELRCQCGGRLTIAGWTEKGFVPRSRDQEARIKQNWMNHAQTWDGYAKKESYGVENY